MGDVAIDAPFISNTGVDLRLFKFKASLKIKILHLSLVSLLAYKDTINSYCFPILKKVTLIYRGLRTIADFTYPPSPTS